LTNKFLAGRRQADTCAIALKERNTQFIFQRTYSAANNGLVGTNHIGRAMKASLFRHHNQVPYGTKIDLRSQRGWSDRIL
jgi:hypothetical protein